MPSVWNPPILGNYKFNFDISLADNRAIAATTLQNHNGDILGAWTNHFFSSNLFCAETEAVVQTFGIAKDLKMQVTNFKGDALPMILSLRGIGQFDDWRARRTIDKGRTFLRNHSAWSINYVNHNCNYCAYKLVFWARHSNLSGKLDATKIPPMVLCDRGGTDVLVQAVGDINDI